MSRKQKRPKKETQSYFLDRPLRGRTDNQVRYMKMVRENDVTIALGPAGCGKTHVAIGMAVRALKMSSNPIDRIIITHPGVESGRSIGFLPGGIDSKLGPYVKPCFDELKYYISYSGLEFFKHNEIIEVVPLAYMRGRTFRNCFIILDEGQNATRKEMKTLLTRIGENSKLILTGDPTQTDLYESESGALSEASRRLDHIDGIGVVHLDQEDIIRHPIIGKIVTALPW